MNMRFCDSSNVSIEFESDDHHDRKLLREIYLKLLGKNDMQLYETLKELFDEDDAE